MAIAPKTNVDKRTDEQPLESGQKSPRPKRPLARWGVGLMLFSGILFALLPAIPFLPMGTGAKFVAGGVVYGAVQLTWWGGAALAGPEAVRKMKGWFRRRKQSVDDESQST